MSQFMRANIKKNGNYASGFCWDVAEGENGSKDAAAI